MNTILSSTPSNNSQLINQSIKLYNVSFFKILLMSFLIGLLTFTSSILFHITGKDLELLQNLALYHHLIKFMITVACMALFVGILWHMHCVLYGMNDTLQDDLEIGIKKALLVIIATIIQSIILLGLAFTMTAIQLLLFNNNWLSFDISLQGFLTLLLFFSECVLLVYVATLFIFFIPIIATEKKGVIASLQHSASLSWNHWWRIFSLQITPWLVYLIFLMFLQFVIGLDIHIYILELQSRSFLGSILHVIIFTVFIPWVAALLLVQLHDLELRKQLETKK